MRRGCCSSCPGATTPGRHVAHRMLTSTPYLPLCFTMRGMGCNAKAAQVRPRRGGAGRRAREGLGARQGAGGPGARSQCRFVLAPIHFYPVSLPYSVALFLKLPRGTMRLCRRRCAGRVERSITRATGASARWRREAARWRWPRPGRYASYWRGQPWAARSCSRAPVCFVCRITNERYRGACG